MAYPRIDQTTDMKICTIIKEASGDIGSLSETSYSDNLKNALTRIIQKEAINDKIEINQEIKSLYLELTRFGQKLSSDDVSEKMAWFKTRAQLSVKLIELQELGDIKDKYEKLKEIVLRFVLDNLDRDQVTELSNAIEAAGVD